MVNAFADLEDAEDAEDVDLSDNVAADYVRYHRGNVVGHEQEGLLMYLSVLTGWTYDDGCHNNVVGMGPPGSGKSLTKNTVAALFDPRDKYNKTEATSNAILDSLEWDLAMAALMDEYDKINRDIIEVLKSSNPEDGGYAKDRNVEDQDAVGGYSPVEVSAEAIPWVLLYAPSSKKASLDDELEDRALVLWFSNNKHTRRGIMRKEFGHDSITTPAADDEYIYDTHGLAAKLRERVRGLPVRREYAETEEGEEYVAARSGDTNVYMPAWVVYACEPIFNIDEDYTNRVFGLVNNAIRASALLNHDRRDRTEVEVYVDEDSMETQTRNAIVVGPQDVANVLSCLPTLLSTTHQLTPLKRHILDAVDATEGATDSGGTTVQRVRDWLNDNDIPHPKEGTLRDRMNELSENYYLQDFPNSGGKNGTATVYEIHDQGALQAPNIRNLQRYADKDGIELGTDEAVNIDPADPFEGCTDPIRGQSFKETVSEFEADFTGSSGSTEEIDMIEAMGGDPSDSADSGASSGSTAGQSSLTGYDDEDGDPEIVDEETVELDPDGEPETPTETWLLDALSESDGEVFGPRDDVTQYLGIVPSGDHITGVDTTDTVCDPTHELWQNRSDHADDRVISETDALRELQEAYGELKRKGLVVEDEDGGPPAMLMLHTV